jgi:hypothetical protein
MNAFVIKNGAIKIGGQKNLAKKTGLPAKPL